MHVHDVLGLAVVCCSCNHQVRLKSLHSKAPSVIVFTNKTIFPVRALWLDFEGNEVVYSVLEPNSTKRYHTYVTHPWIVREVQSSTRMMLSGRPAVVGLSTEQTVEIQAPKQLPWNVSGRVVTVNRVCLQLEWELQGRCLQESVDRATRYGMTAGRTSACRTAIAADSSTLQDVCLQEHVGAIHLQLLFRLYSWVNV
jgi:hypothetical protein